jgi:hypothetical protein
MFSDLHLGHLLVVKDFNSFFMDVLLGHSILSFAVVALKHKVEFSYLKNTNKVPSALGASSVKDFHNASSTPAIELAYREYYKNLPIAQTTTPIAPIYIAILTSNESTLECILSTSCLMWTK